MTKKTRTSKVLDSKLFWIIVSLIASVLIWTYITGTAQMEISRTFSGVKVTFVGSDTLWDSQNLVVTELTTDAITVNITGTRSNIGRLDSKDISAVVDLSGVTKEGTTKAYPTFIYPASVDSGEIVVTSIQPEYIEFTVEQVTTTTVPVRVSFTGSVAEGYVAGEPVCSPETITIYGPVGELDQAAYVLCVIGGENVDRTRTAEVPFTVVDENGNELKTDSMQFDRETVSVTLPVSATKEVPLSVTLLDGAGAAGDNCVVTIEPATITISGDTSIVSGINKITLGTIDLTDFASTFEDTFPIVLDNNVENLTGVTEATVRVEIPGLETKKLIVTDITYTNLPAGYTAAVITRSLEVTIRASADVLSAIKSDNLRAVADMTDISGTGDVSIAVRIYIDGYTGAGAIGDYKITVNLKN